MTIKYVSFSQQKIATKELEALAPYFDALQQSDYKRVKSFLASPYFNRDERLSLLFESLLKAHKKETTHLNGKTLLARWQLKEEEASRAQALITRKVRQLQTLLLDYFAHQHVQQSNTDKLDILLRRFHNQGISSILDKVKTEKQKLLQAAPISPRKLLDTYLLHHYNYYEFDTNHEQDGRLLLQSLMTELNRFHQGMQTMYTAELRNLQRTFTKRPAAGDPAVESRQGSALHRWFAGSIALFDPSEAFSPQHYEEFRARLLDQHEDLHPEIRYILCKYMVNTLSELVNKRGQLEHLAELLFWMKKRVAWTPASIAKMNANEYLNVIVTSAHCGELRFAWTFVEQYAGKLPADDAILAPQLGRAFCHFYAQEYGKTRAILTTYFGPFSTRQYTYTLRSKSLLIRACLADEMLGNDGYDEFLRMKDDFRMYLNRLSEDIPSSYLEAYHNFLYLANKIFLAQKPNPNDNSSARKARFLELREQAQQMEGLIAKKWLLELLAEALELE